MDTNKQVGEGEQKDPFQPTNQALFSARSGAVPVGPYHVSQGFAEEETPWPREGLQMRCSDFLPQTGRFPRAGAGTSPFSDRDLGRGECLSPQTCGFSRCQDPCLPPASLSALRLVGMRTTGVGEGS